MPNGEPIGPLRKSIPELKTALEEAKALSGGVKFDAEKPRTDLISPIAMFSLARVLTFGAKKYAARNWEKGIPWTRIIGAILRHTWAYLGGETHDPETGESHMSHVMCEAMFLVHFEQTRKEFDDREVK